MYQSLHLATIPSKHQPSVLAESLYVRRVLPYLGAQVARSKGQHPDWGVGGVVCLGPEAHL